MSNSRNWVAQKDCPYTPGSVDVSTGATPENSGDATFAQAFGAGPIDVYWSLEDSSPTPRSMAGIGSLSGGSIDVSSPSATFDGTTYDDNPSGVIALTSPVTIRCTLSGDEFDKRITSAGVTYEALDANGDVGTSAGQLAIGDHNHSGVYEPVDATLLRETDVDDTPVDAATTAPISSNWAYDHENASDPHPGYLTPAEGNATYEPIITPKNTAFNVNFGSGAGTACEGNDARLSDSRTPTAHAASHADGGADEIDVASLGSGAATNGHVPIADGAGGVAWGAQTGGGGDLSNAEFPDSAHFASQIAADATVAFTDGNKQSVDAAVNAALTLSAPGVGSYLLKILNSASLTSITPTPKWDSGTAPTWAGTSVLALYYDGTDWFGSAIVGAA